MKTGFKIICNNCGCEKCYIYAEYDCDWEENYEYSGSNIICPNCDNEERI